ncbi:membrane-bound metal-dependent hydrolase YbcI (DUF457 family) [Allostreptomyces psammosilenae]|uniref:Membrane-bound metal-dependent hydrolase YbcI (DUF457 family) n=2 Tax=Allostreptomyces psammosilenae TaxID=1892865 RepID=A0A853A350_9ACTN|nr:membrane-bound metal-dependent hydrolase YbcI (DUF457 family) [Allostreptomyces psammosilenae]
MGPAHSLSGAAAWLGVGALGAAGGAPMPWPVLLIGTIVCAGAALAPDLDHRAATISRAFGPLSKGLCVVIERLAAAVYRATRGPGDPRRSGGHRTLTHTLVWAVLAGLVTTAVVVFGGRWGLLAVLFTHTVLAIEGLLWRAARASSDVLVWLLGATGAWLLSDLATGPAAEAAWLLDASGVPLPAGEPELAWLGLPVVLGALVHCLGDAITVSGCPVLWPLPFGRKRWYPLGPPRALRFKAGSAVENTLLIPLFLVTGGGCGLFALGLV